MANNRYWQLHTEPSGADVGPSMNNWTVVARFPSAKLPQSTTQRLAVFVKGTVGELSYQGPDLPQRGLVQVCLGMDQGGGAGLKSPLHRASFPIREMANDVNVAGDGVQFGFLMVQQAGNGGDRPAIVDSGGFGSFLNTTALTDDIVVWSRVTWNGDSGNQYTASAVVADVQFLVIDMDEMEANDHVRGLVHGPLTLTASTEVLVAQDPNALGSDGDNWMHLAAIQYRTFSPSTFAPRFQFGVSSNGTWGAGSAFNLSAAIGQGRGGLYNTGPELMKHSQPAMFHELVPSGGHQLTVTGTDAALGALLLTQVTWMTTLSIKLDEMVDSNFFAGSSFQSGECATLSSAAPEESYLPLERPAYSLRTITTLFFAMQWGSGAPSSTTPQRESAQLRINNQANNTLHLPQSYVWVDGTRGEQCQVISMVDSSEDSGDARQWRAATVVRTNNAQASNAYLPHLCSGYFLFDPSNSPTGPWTEPAPLVLSIAREATTPLPSLPTAPDAVSTMKVDGFKFGEIAGRTGYKRTWPTWLKVRRAWSLKWEPISSSTAQTLEDFVVDNPRFAFTPPGRAAAVNVAVSGAVDSERLGDGRSTVRFTVVELVWVT